MRKYTNMAAQEKKKRETKGKRNENRERKERKYTRAITLRAKEGNTRREEEEEKTRGRNGGEMKRK